MSGIAGDVAVPHSYNVRDIVSLLWIHSSIQLLLSYFSSAYQPHLQAAAFNYIIIFILTLESL